MQPAGRVVVDVLVYVEIFLFVADDVVVVGSLPNGKSDLFVGQAFKP